MSMQEVDLAIRDLHLNNPHMEAPGWCRYAAEQMKEVAELANKTSPKAIAQVIVFPKDPLPTQEDVHFALKVTGPDNEPIVFNPNATNLFPQFMGPLKLAPGLIPKMTPIENVA